MKRSFSFYENFQILLLAVWVFSIPTNLFWKILPNFGFVGGLQIDYLIPKLYFSDLTSLALIGSWFLQKWRGHRGTRTFKLNRKSKFVVIGMFVFLLRQFFTPLPISSLWFFGSTIIHILTLFAVAHTYKQFPHNRRDITAWLSRALLFTAVFQATLGLYQFLFQREFFGYLFLGEPSLTLGLGLNRIDLSWLDSLIGTHFGYRIAPYGTTPHPNVLGGFLAVSLSWLFHWTRENKKSLTMLSISGCVVAGVMMYLVLLLTGSFASWLTLILGICVLLNHSRSEQMLKTIRFPKPLVLFFFALLSIGFTYSTLGILSVSNMNTESITRREYLNTASVELIKKHPLWGVGLNHFTAELETVLTVQEEVRFVQPSHQFFLLLLAENGVLGALLLSFFLLKYLSATGRAQSVLCTSLILSPLLCFDHFLYTLPQGQLLIVILLSLLSFQFEKE